MGIRITEDGTVIYENEPDIDRELFPNTPEGALDVQVNGTSIVANGVAEIPIASRNDFGVVKLGSAFSLGTGNLLQLVRATNAAVKEGINQAYPIVPYTQNQSAFYGLAKAAGDTTQSTSSNPVGTYTEEAKSAIQLMLGISDIIGPIEGATASNSYSVGDVFLHKGALYKATNAIASGDAIVPGTNCEQTTIIDILKGA